jgi:hypothetical protein
MKIEKVGKDIEVGDTLFLYTEENPSERTPFKVSEIEKSDDYLLAWLESPTRERWFVFLRLEAKYNIQK